MRGVRAAFVFLTRLPVGGFPYAPADWRWANAYFPLVGACIGLLAAAAWHACAPLGTWPAAVAAVTAAMLLTGAFHEDGLADSADALGGGIDERERVLEILKDSRLGTYGSSALFLSILARVVLIERLSPLDASALALVHCMARTPPVALKTLLPYATRGTGARSRDLADGGSTQLVAALALCAIVGAACTTGLAELAWIALATTAAAALLGWRFQRRIGGYTGDFLGAVEQVGEIIVLAVLVACRV
ncbi:MAG: adenosylcobinamide-GDP ribazoletransferase [Planctomycetota bacterium]